MTAGPFTNKTKKALRGQKVATTPKKTKAKKTMVKDSSKTGAKRQKLMGRIEALKKELKGLPKPTKDSPFTAKKAKARKPTRKY